MAAFTLQQLKPKSMGASVACIILLSVSVSNLQKEKKTQMTKAQKSSLPDIMKEKKVKIT